MAFESAIIRSSPASFRERALLVIVPLPDSPSLSLRNHRETTEDASAHNHRAPIGRKIARRDLTLTWTPSRMLRGPQDDPRHAYR